MYVKPVDYDKVIRENKIIIDIEAKLVEMKKDYNDKLQKRFD